MRISRRQPPTRPTASEPHAFVDPPDPRLGLALGGSARGGSVMGMAGPAAITLYSGRIEAMTQRLVDLVEQFCQYQRKQRGKTDRGVSTSTSSGKLAPTTCVYPLKDQR